MINFRTVTSEGKSIKQFDYDIEGYLNDGYTILDKGSFLKQESYSVILFWVMLVKQG